MPDDTKAEAPAIVRTEREAWLAERKNGVGCSDLAALCGEDPRRGQLSLYLDKISKDVSEEDASYLRLGNKFTGPICTEYGHISGRPIFDRGEFTIIRSSEQPILTATLDRETEGSPEYPAPALGVAPLEAKALAWMKEAEWAEEPPMQYLLQLQGQMACTNAQWGSLAALIGGIVIAKPIDIVRNDAIIEVIYERVERFWWHVKNRVPPEPDALPETTRALKKLYPRADPGREIMLGIEDLRIVESWDEARNKKLAAEHDVIEFENRIRARMGTAELGRLPDRHGSVVLRTTTKAPEMCKHCGHEVRHGTVYRTARWWQPEDVRHSRRLALRAGGVK